MPFYPIRYDITCMEVDAVVNAANQSLLGGGGVDGAIHRAAGPKLLRECRTLGGCGTGEAKITRGYDLPAKYVIHTVGPVYRDGMHGEETLLRSCYKNALALAAECGLESMAFPVISAGAYGYPRKEAVRIAEEEIAAFLKTHDMTVYLVFYDANSFMIGRSRYPDLESRIEESRVCPRPNNSARRAIREMACREEAVDAQQISAEEENTRPEKADSRPEKEDSRPEKKESSSFGFSIGTGISRQNEERWIDTLQRMQATSEAQKQSTEPDFCILKSKARPKPRPTLEDALKNRDESFSQMLLRCIDAKGMSDPECYRKANIDKKLFSKIRSKADYRPSKSTVLALAIALELDKEQTVLLLQRAGLAFNMSDTFDIIVEYFISAEKFDLFEINNVLFEYDQPLLGSLAK